MFPPLCISLSPAVIFLSPLHIVLGGKEIREERWFFLLRENTVWINGSRVASVKD